MSTKALRRIVIAVGASANAIVFIHGPWLVNAAMVLAEVCVWFIYALKEEDNDGR